MPIENTANTLSLRSLAGNIADTLAEKQGFPVEMPRRRSIPLRGTIALLLCFLAGVAAAALLLYTLF